jgi:hypothetical protein
MYRYVSFITRFLVSDAEPFLESGAGDFKDLLESIRKGQLLMLEQFQKVCSQLQPQFFYNFIK